MSISAATVKLGIAAIVVGLVGAYLAQVYLAEEETVAASPPPSMTVPLATIDLPAGREIRFGDVGLMRMSRDQVVQRGWDMSRVMLSPEQVIGRTLKDPIRIGEPFETDAMYPEGDGPNPLTRLKPGYRAVDVPVSLVRGGGVAVGDVVDVVFRTTPVPATEEQAGVPEITITLATAMEVIDVGRAGDSGPRVTLAATPDQARKFEVVRDKGEITLLARSPEDSTFSTLAGNEPLTFNELLGIKPPEPPPPPPQVARFDTVIYRAGKPVANSFLLTADDIARYGNAAQQSPSPQPVLPPVDAPPPADSLPSDDAAPSEETVPPVEPVEEVSGSPNVLPILPPLPPEAPDDTSTDVDN